MGVPVLTDLHCHILPGVDDGPPTLDDAVVLARALVRDGVGRVIATPHVSARYPTSAGLVHERVTILRDALAAEGTPLLVEPGAEVSAIRIPDMDAGELGSFGLGGGRWILLEPPLSGEFPFEAAVRDVQAAGHGVVIAHAERSSLFQRDPRRLGLLVDEGARVSITAAAITGGFGRPAQALALALIRTGLVHNVASDAHDVTRRPPRLRQELRTAGLEERIGAWCDGFPAMVLDDDAARTDGGSHQQPSATSLRPDSGR